MAIPVSDKEIRQRLAEIIAPLVSTDKVYSWNVLRTTEPNDIRKAITEWLPHFQTDDKTFGIVIKRAERTSEGAGGDCSNFLIAYDVWAFYGYYSTDEDTNSENDFGEIIDTLADALPAAKTFQVGTTEVFSYGLQFPVISLLFGSEEMVHFAGGRIELSFND